MSTVTEAKKALLGGEWLIKESHSFETFIPEDYNEEQLAALVTRDTMIGVVPARIETARKMQ